MMIIYPKLLHNSSGFRRNFHFVTVSIPYKLHIMSINLVFSELLKKQKDEPAQHMAQAHLSFANI